MSNSPSPYSTIQSKLQSTTISPQQQQATAFGNSALSPQTQLINKHLTAASQQQQFSANASKQYPGQNVVSNKRGADQSHSDSSNSFIRQGSNDSNYSGPSSGGDFSYEENHANKINSPNVAGGGGGGPTGGPGGGGSAANKNQKFQTKQQQQQRSQDAKHELDLCRVSLQFFSC
jgi:hypothetical protein